MFNFLRHLFVPHHTNNHRAKILHHNFLSFVIVFFLALALFLPPLQRNYPSVLGVSINFTNEELLNLTNEKRKEAGLAPLTMSNELSLAASSKASYMFEKNFWAHVAPDGTTPWYFIKNSGYQYQYAGENLARGFNSAEDVVNAWMASPTHRENLLSPNYKDIGFAVAGGVLTGSDTVLVVQEFGSKFVSDEENIAGSQVADITPVPTSIPVQIAQSQSEKSPRSATTVAAAVNNPLIDSRSTTSNLAFILLGIFIVVLIVDALVIERKKIARVVAHNLDHIIFLTILLLAVIIIMGGAVL